MIDVFKNFYNMNRFDFSDFSFDFHESLKYEKKMQPVADEFYKNTLGASQVNRYDWNNPLGRNMQEMDIDCSIELKAKEIGLYWLNISEKFRSLETGDMCLELWSNFQRKTPGWAVLKIPNNIPNYGPDLYLYVTPKHIFEVWANRNFDRMMNDIANELTWEKINEIFDNGSYNATKNIIVNGHKVTLLKTWTDNKYYGICVCIPWKTLLNEYLLDINMYDRSGRKLDVNEIYIE